MAILINNDTRVLVQGITGEMGRSQTEDMVQYGTKVVAGVSPGHGGSSVHGVPVFNTVSRAVVDSGAEMSVIFVGAARAKDAIYEAIEAGIRCIVCVAEFVPVHDAIDIKRRVQASGTRLIGPNCSGLISPGAAKVGFYCAEVCLPGNVGVMTKSGTLSYAILAEMKRHSIGASTVVGVGGDEIKGTSFCDCLELFQADPETRAVLVIGEIGGDDEEMAAARMRAVRGKPVVAFVAGSSIPPGRHIGHAGAMIIGDKGTHRAKVEALAAAGADVAQTLEEIPNLLRRIS